MTTEINADRVQEAYEILRYLDTRDMSTQQLVEFFEGAVPGCTPDELAEALRKAARVHEDEADLLEGYAEWRAQQGIAEPEVSA